MLRGIKNATSNWLGKAVLTVVMGLLVVSFAIWGIGDIFRGFGLSTVATVGSTEVTVDQFRNYYSERMSQITRQLGRPVSPDQARALGLDRQLIGQFVAETALDERARALGLGISDAEIARSIRDDPAFHGLSGGFDRTRFELIIRQAGYNETTYVREQRKIALRRQIAQAISGELKVPDTMAKAIQRFQLETRSVDAITLGAAQAGAIASPDQETLRKYFEERKVLFRAPELRKVALLSLTPAELARWETVPDADARKYYEDRKEEFGAPERRQLRQIVFPKAEDAAAAHARIKGGAGFLDIAKERGLKDSDIDIGLVTKKDVIDPAVADAAFALKADDVSAPVQGRFGTVLVQTVKIEGATQRPYESVADTIKRRLAEDKARGALSELRDKIEDERAGGSTLVETARKLNLASSTIEAIDRSGRDAAGQPIAGLPQGDSLVRAIFATDAGIENDPLQLPGGGYLWYDVMGVTPSRERALEDVKDQIEARWRDDEIAERLKVKTDAILTRLTGGTPLSEIAREYGVPVDSAKDIQRGRTGQALSAKVIEAVFGTAKGASGSSEGDRPGTRVVFTVTDIALAPGDPAQAQSTGAALARAYSEDLVNQYVAKLESELGVRINQQALNQATGAATQ